MTDGQRLSGVGTHVRRLDFTRVVASQCRRPQTTKAAPDLGVYKDASSSIGSQRSATLERSSSVNARTARDLEDQRRNPSGGEPRGAIRGRDGSLSTVVPVYVRPELRRGAVAVTARHRVIPTRWSVTGGLLVGRAAPRSRCERRQRRRHELTTGASTRDPRGAVDIARRFCGNDQRHAGV